MALSLDRKRALDHFIGRPALKTLNLLTRAFGSVLRRNHGVAPVNTILVMKFQGMGSLALAYPALSALRCEYPKARLVFWGTPATCALARLLPEFDDVVSLDDSSVWGAMTSLMGTLPRLWRLKIDWGFDFEVYSKLSAILLTLTCARNRAGFAVDTITSRKDCHTHLVMFNRYQYLGRAYARLVGLVLRDNRNVDMSASPEWREKPHLPAKLQSVDYVVFNPNVGELAPERAWPVDRFNETIARYLSENSKTYVVLTGKGTFEKTISAKITRNPRLIDLTDQLSLPQLIATLAGASAMVTGDTSGLHLALLAGIPVVGLFGPTLPTTYFPLDRSNAVALFEGLYCSPCIHHWHFTPCRGNNQCMQSISTDKVLDALKKVMNVTNIPRERSHYSVESEPYYPGLIYDKDRG